MSCYFRHLAEIFKEAGIEVTAENRRELDLAVHAAVGLSEKHCPTAWKRIKQEFLANEKKRRVLVRELKKAAGGKKSASPRVSRRSACRREK
jgi:hypothetical protein